VYPAGQEEDVRDGMVPGQIGERSWWESLRKVQKLDFRRSIDEQPSPLIKHAALHIGLCVPVYQ
jgi:hypothetical protein